MKILWKKEDVLEYEKYLENLDIKRRDREELEAKKIREVYIAGLKNRLLFLESAIRNARRLGIDTSPSSKVHSLEIEYLLTQNNIIINS